MPTPVVAPIKPPTSSSIAHQEIDVAALPVRTRAGDRRRDDLARTGPDGDRRRHAEEDQERRRDEPAADAEHAREESDDQPKTDQNAQVDRDFGYRQVDAHRRVILAM